MRKPTKYSILIAVLILIGITSFVTLWNMIPANGIALALYAIVATTLALSLIEIILSAREIYKANDMKHRIINILCLMISLITFLIPIIFGYMLDINK